MRVLLRARNSLRSFRCRARKPGPCRARARHFAFSETGQAGHTLGVCCFAPKIRCAHFGAPLANPAPSVPLKNTNSNANNWRICVFLTRHSDGPGPRPAAQEPGFARLASARACGRRTANKVAFSVRARNSKNDIRALRRFAPAGKRDFEKGAATGAPEGKHFRAADVQVGHLWEISIRQPFRWHTVRRAGLLAG